MAISLYTYLRNGMGDILRDTAEPQTPEELCRLYRTISEQLRDQLQQIENDKHDLETQMIERVNNLESRNLELREQLRQVEADKRYIETQKIRFEREVRKLKSESEQLRSPPLIIGNVVDVVDSSRVIVRSSAGPKFLVRSSPSINPDDLKAGARCTLNQQSLAIVELLPSSFDAQVYGMELVDSPQENYTDIGGLSKQINEIREAVELPLKRPELFTRIGIEPPKGVLLYGPPGTGKTLLAKAVAHETNAHFMRVVGSELVQKYIGEGARLVRELFDLAKKKAPTIIFIDEIDAVGASRTEANTSGDREVQRTLMQLLAGMDGFETRGDVKIIGATNRIDILDKALLRPGRFDRIIEIPLPDEEGRLSILKVHTRGLTVDETVDLVEVASMTEGRNGADLRAICMEAGMFAIRNDREAITRSDFLAAIDKVRIDFSRPVSDVEGRMFA
jgi:proteasome regulatory subunit